MIPAASPRVLIGIIFVLFLIYLIMKNRHEKIKRRKKDRSIFRRDRNN